MQSWASSEPVKEEMSSAEALMPSGVCVPAQAVAAEQIHPQPGGTATALYSMALHPARNHLAPPLQGATTNNGASATLPEQSPPQGGRYPLLPSQQCLNAAPGNSQQQPRNCVRTAMPPGQFSHVSSYSRNLLPESYHYFQPQQPVQQAPLSSAAPSPHSRSTTAAKSSPNYRCYEEPGHVVTSVIRGGKRQYEFPSGRPHALPVHPYQHQLVISETEAQQQQHGSRPSSSHHHAQHPPASRTSRRQHPSASIPSSHPFSRVQQSASVPFSGAAAARAGLKSSPPQPSVRPQRPAHRRQERAPRAAPPSSDSEDASSSGSDASSPSSDVSVATFAGGSSTTTASREEHLRHRLQGNGRPTAAVGDQRLRRRRDVGASGSRSPSRRGRPGGRRDSAHGSAKLPPRASVCMIPPSAPTMHSGGGASKIFDSGWLSALTGRFSSNASRLSPSAAPKSQRRRRSSDTSVHGNAENGHPTPASGHSPQFLRGTQRRPSAAVLEAARLLRPNRAREGGLNFFASALRSCSPEGDNVVTPIASGFRGGVTNFGSSRGRVADYGGGGGWGNRTFCKGIRSLSCESISDAPPATDFAALTASANRQRENEQQLGDDKSVIGIIRQLGRKTPLQQRRDDAADVDSATAAGGRPGASQSYRVDDNARDRPQEVLYSHLQGFAFGADARMFGTATGVNPHFVPPKRLLMGGPSGAETSGGSSAASSVGGRSDERSRKHRVFLRVYDISEGLAEKWSKYIMFNRVEGIWHSGVVAFGYEYFYSDGILRMRPQDVENTYAMKLCKVHYIGETSRTRQNFEKFLDSLSALFCGATYDLLEWNCNDFSNLCAMWLLGELSKWKAAPGRRSRRSRRPSDADETAAEDDDEDGGNVYSRALPSTNWAAGRSRELRLREISHAVGGGNRELLEDCIPHYLLEQPSVLAREPVGKVVVSFLKMTQAGKFGGTGGGEDGETVADGTAMLTVAGGSSGLAEACRDAAIKLRSGLQAAADVVQVESVRTAERVQRTRWCC